MHWITEILYYSLHVWEFWYYNLVRYIHIFFPGEEILLVYPKNKRIRVETVSGWFNLKRKIKFMNPESSRRVCPTTCRWSWIYWAPGEGWIWWVRSPGSCRTARKVARPRACSCAAPRNMPSLEAGLGRASCAPWVWWCGVGCRGTGRARSWVSTSCRWCPPPPTPLHRSPTDPGSLSSTVSILHTEVKTYY